MRRTRDLMPFYLYSGLAGAGLLGVLVFVAVSPAPPSTPATAPTSTTSMSEDAAINIATTTVATTAITSTTPTEHSPASEAIINTDNKPTTAEVENPTATPPPAETQTTPVPPPTANEPAADEATPTVTTRDACPSVTDLPFYLDPTGSAIRAERELLAAGDTDTAALMATIACEPVAVWLNGDRSIEVTVSKIDEVYEDIGSNDTIPVFVLYNQGAPGYTEWGSGRTDVTYREWIEAIATTIGSRTAWIILEPDALASTASYDPWHQAKRAAQLGDAVDTLSHGTNAHIYIDTGHSHWLTLDEAAELLRQANIAAADGFSLNVSNYRSTADEIAYGTALAERLEGGKAFVIDTSRNGNGSHPDAQWCNAPGRALGPRPQLTPNTPHLDAYLWVKPPGESDGTCQGGPPAGKFWIEYARELIENAE